MGQEGRSNLSASWLRRSYRLHDHGERPPRAATHVVGFDTSPRLLSIARYVDPGATVPTEVIECSEAAPMEGQRIEHRGDHVAILNWVSLLI